MKSKLDTLVGEKPVATVTYQERLWRLFNRFGPAIMLMAVVAGMSIAHPDFLTISNLMTIGLQASVRALLAIGELLVIISGGIDLSVGTAMSLSMVTMGLYVINSHGSLEIGMLIAIATGVLVGLVNGTLVAFLGLPPFIITLGMLGIAQGLARRSDRPDVIAVMTPNDSYHAICVAALDAGFHLICDKPLTTDLVTAVDLARKVKSTSAEFCLTHCYTGYPMVRQARAMVRAGVIGPIRQVHLQYVQGYLAMDEVPPGWRLDPARVGASMILIDIGIHAHHLGAYVTGLDLVSLCADVGHIVPGRKVDDYGSLLLRYSNDARGSMWVTNAAAGAEHGLSFRIFGETGGLEWNQEEPNRLVHRIRDGFEEIVTRRKDRLVSENRETDDARGDRTPGRLS
jgi:Oxidoreductase family, C-terminal alpha/beta domain/Branched-chain amino acid transport system / permease component/Oxidoreductase family, NAD-binding Rossmann fold